MCVQRVQTDSQPASSSRRNLILSAPLPSGDSDPSLQSYSPAKKNTTTSVNKQLQQDVLILLPWEGL